MRNYLYMVELVGFKGMVYAKNAIEAEILVQADAIKGGYDWSLVKSYRVD